MSRLPELPRVPPPLHRGLDRLMHDGMGRYRRRRAVLRKLQEESAAVAAWQAEFRALTLPALKCRLLEFKDAVRRHPEVRGPEQLKALAVLREAAWRTLDLDPFPVQLLGALALASGHLAEMATGEGKTLTAGLAAALLAWQGKPVHVVTVNDYLVERDATLLRPFFEFCQISVGFVNGEMAPQQRREAYAQAVTYGTSKEFAADFLRDQIQLGALRDPSRRLLRQVLQPQRDGLVMRGLHCAIVDEADSLLIDEAVTPLIISSRSDNPGLRAAVAQAHEVAGRFVQGPHYTLRSRYRDLEFTDAGETLLEEVAGEMTGIWKMKERAAELLRQSLIAREYYQEGRQFMVADGKIVIVDEFTGRPMPDRSWRLGLHQAVEAAQGLTITDPTETIARISFQKFFRLYHRLSGMTGTGAEAAREFWRVYELPVVKIPTNRPSQRQQIRHPLVSSPEEKLRAIVTRVQALRDQHRPVLVGTRNIYASETLAAALREQGIDPQVLNAHRIREEAWIIAQAGQQGHVTIATNMAGRGTDIRLQHGVAETGGLVVLATEPHESARVDRQLYGRCGRQGDPGLVEIFASVDEELVVKFTPEWLRWLAGRWPLLRRVLVPWAQRSAQRQALRQRQRVLEADTWLEQSLSFAEK